MANNPVGSNIMPLRQSIDRNKIKLLGMTV